MKSIIKLINPPSLTIIISTLLITLIQYQQLEKEINQEGETINYKLEQDKLKTNLSLQKKIPRFGFNNLLADWQYLQYIQYLGDSKARKETGYPLIKDYFELVSNYDPLFLKANLELSTTNSIFAGQAPYSVIYLQKIIPYYSPQINPDAYYLWSQKGIDEMLFLGDIPSAIKSYQMSSQWALARGDQRGKVVAERNLRTVKFLKNKPDSKRAKVSAWGTVLFSASDDETRKIAIEKIRGLGGDVIINENTKRIQVVLPKND